MIHNDFIHFLIAEYESRRSRNAKYSMRAFARDLGISPSRLHHILDGQTGLSRAAGEEIADRLKLQDHQRDIFITLIEAKHARSEVQRTFARERLQSLTSPDAAPISEERFRILKDWYNMALLFLVDVEGFQFDARWIGHRLGIQTDKAQEAMDNLVNHGLIACIDGIYQRQTQNMAFRAPDLSTDIKDYNRQLLKKASDSILDVPIKKRDLSASVISINQETLDFAKEEIAKFRKSLTQQLLKKSKNVDAVYCLSLQLFPLDKTWGENENSH